MVWNSFESESSGLNNERIHEKEKRNGRDIKF